MCEYTRYSSYEIFSLQNLVERSQVDIYIPS